MHDVPIRGENRMFRTLLATIAALCSASQARAEDQLIRHVTVVTMDTKGRVEPNRDVLIANGTIVKIAAGGTIRAAGARPVDGRGKWLMPGLIDMHTHVENERLLRLYGKTSTPPDGTLDKDDIFLPFIANGVVQLLALSAMPETVRQAQAIERGDVLGPRIALAPMIDGARPLLPEGISVSASTPESGRKAVRDAAAQGMKFVKVYSGLDLPTFEAVLDQAKRHDMRVAGHIPQRNSGQTARFLVPGFGLVAHAEEFAQQTREPDEAAIPAYVAMAKASGTWLVGTLSLNDRIVEMMRDPSTLKRRSELNYLSPWLYAASTQFNPYVARADAGSIASLGKVVAFNRKLVKAFDEAGIPVLAGSDAPVPGVVPGFSLHDELEAMAAAGLSNRTVLENATRRSAEWLREAASGTVAVGKRGDLILLDADPLADVANTRQIAAVFIQGRMLDRAEIDRRMARLKARTAAGLAAFPKN
jgi:imidazolonepropionase-like amidohydrolase